MTPEDIEEQERKKAQQEAEQATLSANLKAAEDAYAQSQQAMAAEQARVNADRNRTFADMVNEAYDQKMQQERQMRQQEQANTLSAMSTGTTEAVANIINMLSVGQLHATNQQYKTYSQDWMKKADQDLREHRRRRDDLNATMQRLKMQQEQVRTAGRIEDMKLQRDMAADALNRARQAEQTGYQRAKDAEDRALRERQFERQAKQTDASIAQGWARIQQSKDANTTAMLAKGWIPDPKAPGGFRYDPQEAQEKYGVVPSSSSSSSSSGGGSGSIDQLPVIDVNGNVNVANLRPHEVEYVFLTARNAIKEDLGTEDANKFWQEYRMEQDDKGRNAVLLKWMKESPQMGEILKGMDPSYQGVHRNSEKEDTTGETKINVPKGYERYTRRPQQNTRLSKYK